MRLYAALLVGLALVALVPASQAGCPVRRRVVVAPPIVPVVATPTVAVATTYVPVVVPAYSVSYAPNYGEAEMTALHAKLDALEKRIANMASGPPVGTRREAGEMPRADTPAPGDSPQAKAVSLVQSRCAQCHSAPNPKGGFTIFARDQLQVSAKFLGAIYRGGTAGGKKMPPDGQGFSDEEVALILDQLGK